jgi:hypothetical protein
VPSSPPPLKSTASPAPARPRRSSPESRRAKAGDPWPALPLASWKDTCDTLHLWTQIVGKVKLALSPFVNHWWHVALYVSPRGLTTGHVPWRAGHFAMTFDFVAHELRIETSDGAESRLHLRPRSVADFYRELFDTLGRMNINVAIWPMPVEMPDNHIPLDRDQTHAAYDAEAAHTFWRMLLLADRALKEFRSPFIGKCSPVHFFWGSFDLAVTRFSGRRAPVRPEFDGIMREAYSHEVSSAGFWPGGGAVADAAFYSYTVPEPPGFRTAAVRPAQAFYSFQLSEFILMYDDARAAASPERAVREFLESTYEAGATLGNWDRAALEQAPEVPVRAK